MYTKILFLITSLSSKLLESLGNEWLNKRANPGNNTMKEASTLGAFGELEKLEYKVSKAPGA